MGGSSGQATRGALRRDLQAATSVSVVLVSWAPENPQSEAQRRLGRGYLWAGGSLLGVGVPGWRPWRVLANPSSNTQAPFLRGNVIQVNAYANVIANFSEYLQLWMRNSVNGCIRTTGTHRMLAQKTHLAREGDFRQVNVISGRQGPREEVCSQPDRDLNPTASPPGWAAQDKVLNHAETWCLHLYVGMLIGLYRTTGRLSEVTHRAPAGAQLSIVPIL